MKNSIIVFSLVLPAAFAAARELRPDYRIENIPAEDGSVRQCLVFRAKAGVAYQVESSGDLVHWTPGGEIYGLGHEHVTAMREFTPAPAGGGGGGTGTAPEASASIQAALCIQPSSGAAGGTVVSWRSLDDDGPMRALLAADMDAAWDQIPLYWQRYGSHSFFIMNRSVAVTPPAENPPFAPRDAAMFAQLEESFAAMNAAVETSVIQARNAPPAPAAAPGERRFWRIRCDWSVDTDGDGSPDWMEFEMAASGNGALAAGVRGDAFDADTNGDGIPDGGQLDFDLDGVVDAADVGKDDTCANFLIVAVPKYALFPISGEQPPTYSRAPLQISGKGTVLFANGTWSGGVWTPLALQGNGLTGAMARAINDHDVILGFGSLDSPGSATAICFWAGPGAGVPPAAVENGSNPSYMATTTSDSGNSSAYGLVYNLLAPGPVLSNDGTFHMGASWWNPETESYEFKGYLRWKLPATAVGRGTATISSRSMIYDGGGSLSWGWAAKPDDAFSPSGGGLIRWGGTDHACPFVPTNVIIAPGGKPVVMSKYANDSALVFVDGTWKSSDIYGPAIDLAADGTAIGKNQGGKTAPMLINGWWETMADYAPGAPDEWKTKTVLMDTTPNGWVLAGHQGVPETTAPYGVLIPIRLNGVDPAYTPPAVPPGETAPEPPDYFAGGVDHLSVRATGGKGRQQEFWIMAPAGGFTPVRWKSPVNPGCKLKPVCDKADFSPQEISSPGETVQAIGKALAAGDDAAGSDHGVTLKLGAGGTDSLSAPVRVKRMKHRTVRLALHYVYSVDKDGHSALPFFRPEKLPLEEFLNKIYGPQVNVGFEVATFTEGSADAGIDFDLDKDGSLEADIEDERNAATPNAKAPDENSGFNIDVWVIGGDVKLTYLLGIFEEAAYGVAMRDSSKIIINGNQAPHSSIPGVDPMQHVLFTIAHEIGHVVTGHIPHPGERGDPLKLEGTAGSLTYLRKRLMCPGPKADHANPGTCLIKGEWDLIEAWLKANIKDGNQ